jgi:hypothetical protein
MATNEDLNKKYSEATKNFHDAVADSMKSLSGNPSEGDMLGQLLIMSTSQCRLLEGMYVELVEARRDRRANTQ